MTLLTKRMVEKPWGRQVLPAPFVAPEGKRIGEVWFEPPPELSSILVKYIFTSEKLSVQVHPSDMQAAELGEHDRGKEECWLVIAAEPGATLGIGFKESVDAEAMRRAALDGTIEDMMAWHPVVPGDFFYIPAGTVHAIGAGVSLIEIQQNSDITYRLYDYGRPRELHLAKGVAVARGEPYADGLHKPVRDDGATMLVDGPFFAVAHVNGPPLWDSLTYSGGDLLVIPLRGALTQAGAALNAGECYAISDVNELAFGGGCACLLVWQA
ncbi:MAG: class I mannose-6-phosphate isomerase [Novosphingobium sp.]